MQDAAAAAVVASSGEAGDHLPEMGRGVGVSVPVTCLHSSGLAPFPMYASNQSYRPRTPFPDRYYLLHLAL